MNRTFVLIVVGILLALGIVLPAMYSPVSKVGEVSQTMEVLRAFRVVGTSDSRWMQSDCREIQDEFLAGMRAASESDEMMRVLSSVASKIDKLISGVPNSAPNYFKILDGVVCDAWNSPLNVARVDAVKDHANLARTAIDCVVIWSSGKNGVNEYGEGDDIVFPPRRKSLTDKAQ